MLRTQISLTEQERRALDAASVRTGRSIAALIRDAVDAIYGDEQSTDHDLAAMRRARGAGRVERSMGKLGWSECDRAGPLEGSR